MQILRAWYNVAYSMQAHGYCINPADQNCVWKSEVKCFQYFTTACVFIFPFSAQQSVANRGVYTVVSRKAVAMARTSLETGVRVTVVAINAYPSVTSLPEALLNTGNTARNNKFEIKDGIYKNGPHKDAQ
jgi:hypothetical protein